MQGSHNMERARLSNREFEEGEEDAFRDMGYVTTL